MSEGTGGGRVRWPREQAVGHGAALGLQTAVERGETGGALDERVARAKAYAAWEWDGKPAGAAHLVEFGVKQQTTNGLVAGGSDWKRERKGR